ncbi:response regulator [Lysinibacter cavernae]|uniref:DNA-binding NarL/FixJ family response regulator n=1 Tax=Lysinibacter cavernae TaxID=1640652 RepID=A0A7X5R0E2_9MICO|nr:response regulator transcription factor [Lysinibacter cavernae]NIH53369.1 DNA-binding NarL/FixJ family response regulator [Lysinibacter cavernae]
MTIRVLIADDHDAVRAGVRALIETASDIAVVGEASDGVQAIEFATTTPCDVVLMDVQMPTTDGLSATRQIVASGGPQIIVLTTFGFDDYVDDALLFGAAGFLLKTVGREALIDAIRRVHAGESILAPEITKSLVQRYQRARSGPEAVNGDQQGGVSDDLAIPRQRLTQLTDREREVLRCLGKGLTNSEIATELYISENTAKTHVSRVLSKLGLTSRVQAALLSASA